MRINNLAKVISSVAQGANIDAKDDVSLIDTLSSKYILIFGSIVSHITIKLSTLH